MPSSNVKAIQESRRFRRVMASTLQRWRAHMEENNGRYRVVGAELVEGDHVGTAILCDGRWTPWPLDLKKEGHRLAVCERGSTLLWNQETSTWRCVRLGCGSRACPACLRSKSAKQCARWKPALEAAAADGAEIRHWTLTQPRTIEAGGTVLPHEADRYGWTGHVSTDGVWPGEAPGRPVEGETLGEAYKRVRDALRAWKRNQSTRALVSRVLGGHLVGVEWTGRARGGIPSWHAHIHILGTTLREVPERDVRAALQAWCALTGGSMKAQHCRVVEPGPGLAECVKYPFKPVSLTQAQRISCLAYMRGLKPHQVAGPWHGASNEGKSGPWARWKEARNDAQPWKRLHVFEDGAEVPVLYDGTPWAGKAKFGVLGSDGRWVTWDFDAAVYARALGKAEEGQPWVCDAAELSCALFPDAPS